MDKLSSFFFFRTYTEISTKLKKDGLNKKTTTSQMSLDTLIQFNIHQMLMIKSNEKSL